MLHSSLRLENSFSPFLFFCANSSWIFFPTENIFFSFDKKKSSICWYRCQGGRKTVFCLFVVIMISSFLIHRLLFWSLQGGNRLLDEAVNGWGCWRKKNCFSLQTKIWTCNILRCNKDRHSQKRDSLSTKSNVYGLSNCAFFLIP